MKQICKRVWWKISAYCLLTGWLSFWAQVRLGSRFAMLTLPDGSRTADMLRWTVISCVLFLCVIFGGFLLFRKMTRREIVCSATVLAVLSAVMGLALRGTRFSTLSLYWAELTSWNDFPVQIFTALGLPDWLTAVLRWLTPYLFVTFGRKAADMTDAPDIPAEELP